MQQTVLTRGLTTGTIKHFLHDELSNWWKWIV